MTYEQWFEQVNQQLLARGMNYTDWQAYWRFNFEAEYKAGTSPQDAADSANRFWWFNQNVGIMQNCLKTKMCWLPDRHQGDCEPIDKNGHRS